MHHVEKNTPNAYKGFYVAYIETIIRLVPRQYIHVHICCFILRIVSSPLFCVGVNQKIEFGGNLL